MESPEGMDIQETPEPLAAILMVTTTMFKWLSLASSAQKHQQVQQESPEGPEIQEDPALRDLQD